jgi:hypothetical protein
MFFNSESLNIQLIIDFHNSLKINLLHPIMGEFTGNSVAKHSIFEVSKRLLKAPQYK